MHLRQLLLTASVFGLILTTGCASYLVDRGRDALDIVTLTVGTGLGAGVRAGPMHVGLIVNKDKAGVVAGGVDLGRNAPGEVSCGIWFDPLFGWPTSEGFVTGAFGVNGGEVAEQRGKVYGMVGKNIPFVFLPEIEPYSETYPWHAFTQIDAAVGLGLSVHVGANPGELCDFLLGWFTLDLYRDDVGTTP